MSGWSVSALLNYFSGTPLSFTTSTNPLPNAWNGSVNRANIAPGDLKNASFDRSVFNFANIMSPVNTYLDRSKFSDPAALTLGNAAPFYTQIRGFGRVNEDISLIKNTRLGERVRWQIRADLLNAFNRPQLGGIQTNVTNPQFGQVTSFSGNRTVQIISRIDF